MIDHRTPIQLNYFNADSRLRKAARFAVRSIPVGFALSWFLSLAICAQTSPPVIVQPGAPGQPSKILPSTTQVVLPQRSAKDVEFMQGMIMHHSQAVEMVEFMATRTENKELRLFGARISQSQSAEMDLMRRWLGVRGEPISMPEMDMGDMDMPGMDMSVHQMLMPGMLTAKQMTALKKAKGSEFDLLFLTGMIQHHTGALTMVKNLFDTAGAGQDADLFNFVTDVDSGQRAEIRIMQKMLDRKTLR